MAEYSLGTAHGTIEITYDGKGVDQATKDVENAKARLEGSSGAVGAALGTVGSAATKMGLAAGAGFGLAAKTAMDFESQMNEVKAVSGATGAEMEQLSTKARQIGKDTAFGATEAASAISELVKAGVTVPDVMNGAADATVALAAAGGIDLPAAAMIASNALNQFGLSGSDMVRVSDLIAGAANASAIDVGDFGYSLSQVGAVANLAGLSFDDTAVAIAQLGNAGIKGSDAGTSLKSMLMNLQPTTKAQTALFEELGIVTEDGANRFYTAEGRLKSMSEVSQILQDALKGMTEEQKMATLETMFGADAIRGAAVLAEGGAEGFNKMADAMGKVSAADVAKTRLEGMKGTLEDFKGSVEDLGITIGLALLPKLVQFISFLDRMVTKFANLPQGTQTMIAGIVGAIGALSLFIGVTIKVVQSLQAVHQTFTVLKTAMGIGKTAADSASAASRLSSAFSAMGSGIKSGAMAFGHFIAEAARATAAMARTAAATIAHWARMAAAAIANAARMAMAWTIGFIQGSAQAIASLARAAAAWVMNWARMAAAGIANAARMATAWVIGFVSGSATAIASVVAAAVAWLVQWALMAAGALASAASMAAAWFIALGPIGWAIAAIIAIVVLIIANWDKVKEYTIIAWNAIAQAVTVAWEWLMNAISTGLTILQALWSAGWSMLKNHVMMVWNGIVAFFTGAWNLLVTLFQMYISMVTTVWSTGWNILVSVVTAVWNFITSAISVAWSVIVSIVTTHINNVKSIMSAVWNAIQAVTGAIWNTIASVISSTWSTIHSTVTAAASAVQNFVSNAWNQMVSIVTSAMSSFTSAVSNGFNEAVSFAASLPGRVMGALGNLGGLLVGSGQALVQGFINGIRSMVGAVASAASSVVQAARDFFPFSPAKKGPFSGKGWVLYSGRSLMEAFADGIKQRVDYVTKTVGNAMTDIRREWDSQDMNYKLESTISAGRNFMDAFTAGMEGNTGHMEKIVQGIADIFTKGDYTGALGDALGVEEDSPIVDALFNAKQWAESKGLLNDRAKAVISSLPGTISKAFAGMKVLAKNPLINKGAQMMQGFLVGVESKYGMIKNSLGQFAKALGSNNPLGAFLTNAVNNDLGEGLLRSATNAVTAIVNAGGSGASPGKSALVGEMNIVTQRDNANDIIEEAMFGMRRVGKGVY